MGKDMCMVSRLHYYCWISLQEGKQKCLEDSGCIKCPELHIYS